MRLRFLRDVPEGLHLRTYPGGRLVFWGVQRTQLLGAGGELSAELAGRVAFCDTDGRSVLELPGAQVGGLYTWQVALRSAAGEQTILATCTPERRIEVGLLDGDRLFALETGKSLAPSVVALGLDGTVHGRWALPKGHKPGRLLRTAQHLVHANLWGKVALLDERTGKWRTLSGGVVRVRSNLEDGLSTFVLSASERVLLGLAKGGELAHAWRVDGADAAPIPTPHAGALLFGDDVYVVRRDVERSTLVGGGAELVLDGRPVVRAVGADRFLAITEPRHATSGVRHPAHVSLRELAGGREIDRLDLPVELHAPVSFEVRGTMLAAGARAHAAVVDIDLPA